MPVHVVKRGGKYRVVEANGTIAKTKNGKARDGGGHSSRAAAHAQASHINGSSKKRK